MVYHFSDLFQYISSGSKENLAEWQVRLKAEKIETSWQIIKILYNT